MPWFVLTQRHSSTAASDHGLFQFEAVPEQLKNAVLVMTAQEILVPPSNGNRTEDQAKFWDATFSVRLYERL